MVGMITPMTQLDPTRRRRSDARPSATPAGQPGVFREQTEERTNLEAVVPPADVALSGAARRVLQSPVDAVLTVGST
jgi:hypothetical protein